MTSLTILAGLSISAVLGQPTSPRQTPPTGEIARDFVDEHGHVRGCVVVGEVPGERLPAVPRCNVVQLDTNGNEIPMGVERVAGDRVDLVIVGDGYQSAQLATYASHASTSTAALFNTEPFKTYAPFFRVYRVDVVSTDSGVDNDPTQGILRTTAMNMAYWCGGTERLLCVSTSLAAAYANQAPNGRNQVLALANSSKYGGAGYPSADIGTAAGANASAAQIAIHEFGHSLGELADEYDYGGPTIFADPEPTDVNSSIYPSATMALQQRKWWRWLGVNNAAFDGLVNTYEGSSYSPQGVYRPTNNSMMRSLGRPFNLPSAEGLIIEFYKIVEPIASVSPLTTQLLTGAELVQVTPMGTVANPLAIQWSLDGSPISGATATTLSLPSLSLTPGPHTLSVTVADNTFMVRDPAARAAWMTQTKQWNMAVPSCAADLDNGSGTGTRDNAVDVSDILFFLTNFEIGSAAVDLDNDGVNPPQPDGGVDVNDLLFFLMRFEGGC
jgi:IgA Peptidase M64